MFNFPKIKIIFSCTYILSPQLSSKLLKGPETSKDLTRLRAKENPSGLHGACVECLARKEAVVEGDAFALPWSQQHLLCTRHWLHSGVSLCPQRWNLGTSNNQSVEVCAAEGRVPENTAGQRTQQKLAQMPLS